ncbi:MAG: ABC transporter ATPase [Saprospiraceae bacterium]|nr:ABC transporter ATPase [Saprospiraceae bacterium]
MIVDIKILDDSSKVWIYQSKSLLTDDEVDCIRDDLNAFLENWTSHNARLYTYGDIFHHRFIVLFVDERFAGTSGCSIDKSVHFIEALERKYNLSLTERTEVAYFEKTGKPESEEANIIKLVLLHDLKDAYEKGLINENTMVFNNLVKTKEEFLSKWANPLGKSWHMRFV